MTGAGAGGLDGCGLRVACRIATVRWSLIHNRVEEKRGVGRSSCVRGGTENGACGFVVGGCDWTVWQSATPSD